MEKIKEWLRRTDTPWPGLIRIGFGLALTFVAPFTGDLFCPGLFILGIIVFVMGIVKLIKWIEG